MFTPFTFQQPQLVTNGLVFSLDASDRTSYPGYGTTWNSLNGSKTAALTNGPTYSSNSGGVITFDGVDDSALIDSNTFGYSPGTTGELTLEMWINPTGPFSSYVPSPPTTNLGGFFGQGYFGNVTGWGIGMFTANGNNYWAFQVRNFGTVVQSDADNNLIFTTGSWYYVVGSFTRNNFSRTYINGQLKTSISSTSLNGLTITPNINDASLGRGGFMPFYSGCKIAVAKIYNRPLSAAEIAQNFNAQRQRFNI